MTTYDLIRRMIARGAYVRADMIGKLDVFLLAGRIAPEQYTELVGMMGDAE